MPARGWTNMASLRRFCLFLLLAIAITAAFSPDLWAKPVTLEKALDAARGWLAVNRWVASPSGEVLTVGRIRPFKTAQGDVIAYIVDLEPRGFIIVPADDLVEPILGYSTESEFPGQPKPGEVVYDLLAVDIPARIAAQKTAAAGPTAAGVYAGRVAQRWARFTAIAQGRMPVASDTRAGVVNPVVNPLIKDLWDQSGQTSQGEPTYNRFTPNNYVTGCVATALAMIIHYFRYPADATCQNTIYVDGNPQEAFFSDTFNYDLMPTQLLPNTPANQIDEVAKLSYDCGIAVKMNYGPDGSYAYFADILTALKDTFKYTSADWKDGEDPDWRQVLKNELNAGYPVEMGIHSTADLSGHAIVCDGWGMEDGADRFHLNMGWGGYYNNWYAVPGFSAGGMVWDVMDGYVYNIRAPGVSIVTCIVTGPTSPTNQSPVVFRIHFSDAVTGLTADEIEVTGGTKGTLTGGGQDYTLPVTPTADGSVTCHVPAGVAQNAQGKANEESNICTIIYDSKAPTCTVSAPATYTTADPIEFVIRFSEPVTGLTADKITVTGGSKGALTGSGADYMLPVTPLDWADVTCQVNSGAAKDAAGNPCPASNVATVRFDAAAPSVRITVPTQNPTYTTAAPTIDIAGTAYDANGLVSLTWSNSRGGSGPCVGTTSWSVSAIALMPGQNTITVTATNTLGRSSSDALYVNYTSSNQVQIGICPGSVGLAVGYTQQFDVYRMSPDGSEAPEWESVVWQADAAAGTVNETGLFSADGAPDTYAAAVTAALASNPQAAPRSVPVEIFVPESDGGYVVERWWGRTPPYRIGYARDVAVDSTGCIYVLDQVNCRVQQFDLGGNYVRHWGSEGSGEGRLRSPCGIALDSQDNVYVADTGNHRIQKFSASGEFLAAFGSFGAGNGQLNAPEGVAVDAAGYIYVADTGNFRVQVFDPNGGYVRKWGSAGQGDGRFGSPSGIAVDSSGNVYVSDRSLSAPCIQKFTSTGTFLARWGSYGSGDGQFMSCRDVAVVGSQYVFATDSARRVQKFSSSGAFLGKWGTAGSGDGQFGDIYGIAVDANGLVYVADAGNSRVQKFEPTGVFAAKWGFEIAGLGQLKRPGQIAVTPEGKIYVADTDNCRIQVFDTAGRLLQHWGSAGVGAGQFKAPRAVAVSSTGEVYVADTGNHRVQVFDSDGVFLRQFGLFGRNPGQFDGPSGIAVGPDNKVYVTDARGRVQRFSPEGLYEASFYSNGGSVPTADAWKGVAVDAGGNVYVVDEYGNCIQKFDSNGVFKAKWGTLGSENGRFFQPSGIAVDADGRVYVADTQNHRVQVFDSSGGYLGQWGTYGGLAGQLANPAGVGVDSSGNVYVSDTDNNRIQKFKPYSAALAPVILVPTAEASYCSQLASIDIAGTTIADVVEVTWSNDRGGSGTCTLDAGRWAADAIELQLGVNVITVTARDAAGGTGSAELSVTYDPVAPVLAVTSEVPAEVGTAYLTVRGTASDNIEVTGVEWVNTTTGERGTCTGTTDWEGTVMLAVGPNNVVVYAVDGCGNYASQSLPEIRYVDSDPPEIGHADVTVVGDPPEGRLVAYVSDWGGVDRVIWTNDLGDTGDCEPVATGSAGGDQPRPPLGQEWTASGIPLHVGQNTITVTAYDTSGNWSAKQVEVLLPDVTAPIVTITVPTAEPTYTTEDEIVTIQGTASDDLAVVNVTWTNDQGGSGACEGTTAWAAADVPLKLGENRITVTAADAAGNVGTDTLTITRIGTDPPTVTITSPTADPTWTTILRTLDLAGTASDDVAVAYVTWSNDRGGSGTCTGTTSWSVTGIPLEVGANVITVTAYDSAGKTGQDVITVTFTDRTAPKVTITMPDTDPYATWEAAVDIAGSATDDVAATEVFWKSDRGHSGSCVGTDSWSAGAVPLEIGQNIITVTAVDAAGNRGSAAVAVVRADGEKPTISITQPTTEPTYSTTDPTIDVAGTADDNVGVVSVVAANDRGGTWLCSGTSSWTASGIELKAGENVLTFTARDASGNTESAQLTVTLTDAVPPTITITDPTDEPAYSTSAAVMSIAGTASDDVELAGVKWSSSAGGGGDCAGTTSWSADNIALAMGANVITVTAVDGAGNESTDTITVTRTDGTPPTVVITAPTSGATYATTVGTLAISGTADDDVGVVGVTWSNNRGGSGACSGTTSWSKTGIVLYIGENVITVRATDAAGNYGTDTLTVTYTDVDKPSVTITSPTSAETYLTQNGTIDLAGTASDNVGVVSVTWSNNRGGSGACTGTTSWSKAGIPLYVGENVITVTAADAAGNTASDVLTVTVADIQSPTVEITSPTADPEITRSCREITIGGTASDNVAVALVEWSNDRGGSGTCSGTESWTAAVQGLSTGRNVITVTAHDTAGNTATDTLVVTCRDFSADVGAAWRGVAMVSLPIIPDSTDPKPVVGFCGTQWATFQTDIGDYVSYANDPNHLTWFEPPTATPGRGFWAYFDQQAEVPCGMVPPQDGEAVIHLKAGWNLIGQPFTAAVAWNTSAIRVRDGADERTLAEAAQAGWVKDFAWGWRPDPKPSAPYAGAYYLVADPSVVPGATGVLDPWRAYWLKAVKEVDLVIPAP